MGPPIGAKGLSGRGVGQPSGLYPGCPSNGTRRESDAHRGNNRFTKIYYIFGMLIRVVSKTKMGEDGSVGRGRMRT